MSIQIELPPIPEEYRKLFRAHAKRRHAMMSEEKKKEWKEKLKKASKKRWAKVSKKEKKRLMSAMAMKRWHKA